MGPFDTTTAALLQLVDWLTEHEVTHAAMKRMGVLRNLTALLALWGGTNHATTTRDGRPGSQRRLAVRAGGGLSAGAGFEPEEPRHGNARNRAQGAHGGGRHHPAAGRPLGGGSRAAGHR